MPDYDLYAAAGNHNYQTRSRKYRYLDLIVLTQRIQQTLSVLMNGFGTGIATSVASAYDTLTLDTIASDLESYVPAETPKSLRGMKLRTMKL